jgi:preprotein translocase subunit YajC
MGLVILGIIGAALLVMMFYFFLSRKSSKGLKLLALGALIVSGITMAVCGFFIAFGARAVEEEEILEQAILNEPAAPEKTGGIVNFVIFLAVLVIFFGVIIFLGIRDQRKRAADAA